MDTILNYLENMFMNLPQTPDVLRAKAELAAMMEDKYQELLETGKSDNEAVGIVISEFGNLKELSEELGIGEICGEAHVKIEQKFVNDTEARQFLELNQKSAKGFGFATMLCIFSPIVLIILAGMQEKNAWITDAVLLCGGVVPLLCFVAVGVGFFIFYGVCLEKYEYMKKERVSISPEIEKYVRSQMDEVERAFLVKLIAGVILCILSVVPLIMVGGLLQGDSMYCCFMVAIMLFVIGIAVNLIISGAIMKEGLQILLQEGEYTPQKKADQKVGGIYWPLITCIYLVWSFVTGAWGITWLIWPIAGVLYAAILPVYHAVVKK